MKLTLCAPCLFGLEGPLGNELRHMDMENVAPENGRVYFTGDESAVARANIRSRFAERVLIVLGRSRRAASTSFSRAYARCRGRLSSPRTARSPSRAGRLKARSTPCRTARKS